MCGSFWFIDNGVGGTGIRLVGVVKPAGFTWIDEALAAWLMVTS